jgi:chromosomal replication initiator protein
LSTPVPPTTRRSSTAASAWQTTGQAIGNLVQDRNANAKIRYIHAEQYVSDVVRAYQHKAFDGFKKYYHSLDLLLIDDIQFFSGKTRTQEEFFYAFNALIEAHKQVIITCDIIRRRSARRPADLALVGLTVTSHPGAGARGDPDQEGRGDGLGLVEDVAFFIAPHQSNVRERRGLETGDRHSNFPATISELAREALKDLLAIQYRQISIDNIQRTVADYYKIKVSEMYSKKRSRNVARPRQMAMAIAKELTQLSLPDIGEAFGGRDHTTCYACRKIAELKPRTPTSAGTSSPAARCVPEHPGDQNVLHHLIQPVRFHPPSTGYPVPTDIFPPANGPGTAANCTAPSRSLPTIRK